MKFCKNPNCGRRYVRGIKNCDCLQGVLERKSRTIISKPREKVDVLEHRPICTGWVCPNKKCQSKTAYFYQKQTHPP